MLKPVLLKPRLFRIELLSHETDLKPASEVLEEVTKLFTKSIESGRKVRVYIRVEYGETPKGEDTGQ